MPVAVSLCLSPSENPGYASGMVAQLINYAVDEVALRHLFAMQAKIFVKFYAKMINHPKKYEFFKCPSYFAHGYVIALKK